MCPQIFGLYTVKLAGKTFVLTFRFTRNSFIHFFFCTVALTLIGGVQHVDASGTRVRGETHLLLVGDPG